MAGVNKVILIGNLGKDPEIRHLPSGTSIATFSVATSESYKDKAGNRVDQTEWHNIEVWDQQAKIAEQYLKKGMTVYLEGKIKTDTWDDKDGSKKSAVKIRCTNFTMLGSKNPNSESTPNNYAPTASNQQKSVASNTEPVDLVKDELDDLPF